jgi:hypothetical protein
MDTDMRALVMIAQAYFDAAHDMDADRFASLFHPSSSVSAVARYFIDMLACAKIAHAWKIVQKVTSVTTDDLAAAHARRGSSD